MDVPDGLTIEDTESLVTSIITEMLFPDIAQHDAPIDILKEWLMSFPEEERSGTLYAVTISAIAMLSQLTKGASKDAKKKFPGEHEWSSDYMGRINKRIRMNAKVDNDDA